MVAGLESDLALWVAQIDGAVNQTEHNAAIIRHREVELRPPNCARNERSLEIRFDGSG